MDNTEALYNLTYKEVIDRFNNNELSTKEIKALLKHYTKISKYCAGVRDIVFIYKLEDFLAHLRRKNHDLLN